MADTLPPDYFVSNVVGFGFIDIYCGIFVRHCGSRTAGEALFFCSQKKYPKKAVATPDAPVKGTGVPIEGCRVTCCARTHPRKTRGLRQLAQKAHVTRHPSMAWLMRGKVKNEKQKPKYRQKQKLILNL